jgi:hypothetical protein
MYAERSHAVARAEEGEVTLDDLVQKRLDLAFDPSLHGGLGRRRIGRGERSAAEQDTRVIVEVQPRQRRGFHADAAELVGGQARGAEERGVLVVRGDVLGARGQQQKGPHRTDRMPIGTAADICSLVAARVSGGRTAEIVVSAKP